MSTVRCKYGLLAATHVCLIFYSADFRDTAGGFLELSRDGRIGHFSPKCCVQRDIGRKNSYEDDRSLLCSFESINDLVVS